MAEILNITKTAARAYQAWPLLVWAATHRQIVTYKYMAALTGMGVSGVGSVRLIRFGGIAIKITILH